MQESESESYVTTDGQSASLSWNKASIWGLRPDLYYCQTVTGLLILGALSDERTGLSFVYAAGPCQRSLSRVRVPWDLRPYFTVSDLRLPYVCRLYIGVIYICVCKTVQYLFNTDLRRERLLQLTISNSNSDLGWCSAPPVDPLTEKGR
jgi:hypothetical protein